MPKEKREPGPKWKQRELKQPIKWAGPPLRPSFIAALGHPDQAAAEMEERARARNDAENKCVAEQLRKLPLLAQEYEIDAPRDAGEAVARMAVSNDLWVLRLLLTLAEKLVPGFKRDTGARRGARRWNEIAQAELIADIETVKLNAKRGCGDSEACLRLVTWSQYETRYKGDPKRSSRKRAISLNSRLVEARNGRGLVPRLLANAEGEHKQLLIYQIISNFGCAASDRNAAKARADALMQSWAQETARLEALANAAEQKRPRPAN